MHSGVLLLEHGIALALIWAAVMLAGLALLPILRSRIGFAGAPLIGVVYWTLALYLLPFSGGLDIATGFVILLAGVHLYRCWRAHAWTPVWRRFSWATLTLLAGSLAYTTTPLSHYAPFGMDATMHTTAAALIGRAHGLPADYAPLSPGVPFAPVNLGLPAVGGVAIGWGGEPAAVMLACHHLTFTCLILATYVLLRLWTGRNSAALLAVTTVWLARASESTIGWGGFPTVMSVAVGVLAARLIFQHARSHSWRLSLATGATVAAIPLVHGVGAATWLYCAGLWIGLAALWQTRSFWATARSLALAGVFTGIFLLAYRWSAPLDLQTADMQTTRAFVEQNAPPEGGLRAWLFAWSYVPKDSGMVVVCLGWTACVFIALRGRLGAALLLAGAWLSITLVVANARWYVLPASFLLYPERVLYWAAPLSGVGLALAWRSAPPTWRQAGSAAIAALVLFAGSAYFQNIFYQKIVRESGIDREEWEVLVWAKRHLDGRQHFVKADYNSIGAYLPPVSMVDCTGSHHHHFLMRQIGELYARRPHTHLLMPNDGNDAAPISGKTVFRNRRFIVVELPPPAVSERTARSPI